MKRALGGVFALVVLIALVGVLRPFFLKSKKKTNLIQATSNARQMYAVCMDAANDLETDGSLVDSSGFKSSNEFFAQWIHEGFIDSEEIFYCSHRRIGKKNKPDNVIGKKGEKSKALEMGECGFAWIPLEGHLFKEMAEGSPLYQRPLIVTPAISSDGVFDSRGLEKSKNLAVICRLDGAVKTGRILKSGKVQVNGKFTLFDKKAPWWGGKPVPSVLLPLMEK